MGGTMVVELHTFDPDGDLLLILSRPDDSAESENEEADRGDTSNTPAGSATNDGTGEDAVENGEAVPDTEVSADSVGPPSLDDPSGPNGDETDEMPLIVVHMLVSSKHMMLASPVFKAMLQHSTFKEGKKLSSAGKVEIPLPDDDPTPFKVVLDIIHGRNKLVPRKIHLDMLTSMSIVVDKYQMAEAVESYSEGWIEALKEHLPTKYTTLEEMGPVHRWLGISWVFGRSDEFKKMTMLTEKGCNADLKDAIDVIEEGLPIPDLILDTILEKWQGALFELYGLIEQTVRRYQRHEILCPRTDNAEWRILCDSLLLGSLLKSATTLGIMPVPDSPYGDVSFDRMIANLQSLRVNAICDSISRPTIGGIHPKPAHGFKKTIQERIESLEERLSGLDIQDFKAKGKSPRPLVGV